MKYIKKYERTKKYYSVYDDMVDDHKDIDYFLNIIKKQNLTSNQVETLFFWSCRKFPELAIVLVDFMEFSSILKSIRGIVQLSFKDFKTVLQKRDLYKQLINNNEFLENVIYYSDDDIKKLELLEKLGTIFTQSLLINACYTEKVETVKYLVSKGLDPNEKIKSTYSRAPQNCLDISTLYNKTPHIIEYLVDLGIPVTYRHMYNVLVRDNLKALPFLVNYKKITNDYSHSDYATQSEDKYAIQLSRIVGLMLNKGQEVLLKKLLIKEKDYGYNYLQTLPDIKINNIKCLNPNFLEFAYWIIKKYKGKYCNQNTTNFITRNNEEFWFKKIKKDPSIIPNLISVEFNQLYEFQKIILDIDEKNLKYILNNLHPTIISEYSHIPEILELLLKRYNL